MPITFDDLAQEVRLLRSDVSLVVVSGDGDGGGDSHPINDHDVEGGEITAYDSTTGIATILLDSGETISALVIPAGIGSGGGTTSPLTTKGDVWGYSTVDVWVPVGTNGQVLTADSAQTLGLKWATSSGGFDASTGSWFYANSQSDTGLAGKSGTANSFVSVPFTASGFVTNTSSGSDISVNGSGNIVINTAGVYSFHAYINPQADATGATGYTQGSGRVLVNTARFGGNLRFTDSAFPATDRNSRLFVICTMSESLYLAVGDIITTQALMVGNGTPSTTWSIVEAEIWVERHA